MPFRIPSVKITNSFSPPSFKGNQIYASSVTSDFAGFGVGSAPKTIADAGFKGETLRISTSKKNMLDSNIWYAINKDGSGLIQTAWCAGKDVQKGTYSEIYKKAQAMAEGDGDEKKISEKDALLLVEEIKKINIYEQPGCD